MTEASRSTSMAHRGGPPAGTRAVADVYARNAGGGGVDFTLDWRWEDGTAGGTGAIDIPAKKKGEKSTPIDFHLHDETKPPRGFVFTDDPEGPIWVDRSTCPNGQCGDGEIPSSEIKRNDKKLSLVDLNKDKCELHYRLRFKDKDGKPDSYDPEIKNGGST